MLRSPNFSTIHSDTRRRLLLGAAGSITMLLAGCGDSGTGDANTGSTMNARIAAAPRLPSVANFRDIAGADASSVYRTASGQILRRGVFYRSNALTPSATDLVTLSGLGIRAIYDLRTPSEIAKDPDASLAGATWTNFNLLGTDAAEPPPLKTAAEGIALMEDYNRQMVTNADRRAQLAQLYTAMARQAGVQVVHCTAGKDRTGWVAAVLLSLVNVPQDVIMQDYLLSNQYLAADIDAQTAAMVTAYGQAYADAYRPVLGVSASFLQAGLDQATQSYGSMSAYITDGLGLDASTQANLRAKLLY